jgi:hypothetical protein
MMIVAVGVPLFYVFSLLMVPIFLYTWCLKSRISHNLDDYKPMDDIEMQSNSTISSGIE